MEPCQGFDPGSNPGSRIFRKKRAFPIPNYFGLRFYPPESFTGMNPPQRKRKLVMRTVAPKKGFGRSDKKYHGVFNREGVDARKPSNVTISDLHSASIFLFKHILHPTEARWRLAYKYARLKADRAFEPINLHNALIAKYGSKTLSFQTRYANTYIALQNVTHLARALANIEIGHNLFSAIEKTTNIGQGYQTKFEQTQSISRGKDKRGVTGCPEALWQLQLYHNNIYTGRVGFNFHREGKKPVLTITNIQGAEGRGNELNGFKDKFGTRFNEYLVNLLKQTFGQYFEIRGIVNQEKNAAMYAMTFRKAKIPIIRNSEITE